MKTKEVDYLTKQGLTESQRCDAMHELGLFALEGLYAKTPFDVVWQNRFKALDEKMQAIDGRVDSFKLIELAIEPNDWLLGIHKSTSSNLKSLREVCP